MTKPKLEFKPKPKSINVNETIATFRVLQLADLHYGEGENKEWGPIADLNSTRVIQYLIETEQPDLVILSGDQITANNIDKNASSYYTQIIQAMLDINPNVKWAMTFGNHDDMSFIPNNYISVQQKQKSLAYFSRQDLLKLDQSYQGSYTGYAALYSNLSSLSNYYIPLYYNSQEISRIYMLDSGGGSIKEEITQDQINYFNSINNQSLASIAFQHIPPQGFDFDFKTCVGMKDDYITPVDKDAGILQTMSEAGNILFIGMGHDHGNDFCCPFQNKLNVCFGRHSGYGGYCRHYWEKGARIYELSFNADADEREESIAWHSWVRLEFGSVIHHYTPSLSTQENSDITGFMAHGSIGQKVLIILTCTLMSILITTLFIVKIVKLGRMTRDRASSTLSSFAYSKI